MQKILSAVTFALLIVACGPQPDFTTPQGVEVYKNGIREITPALMWKAIELYAIEFPKELGFISEHKVRNALSWVVLEWEREPFGCWYKKDGRWVEGLCSGTQDYEYLRVVWFGTIPDTALYHELTHWIMQCEFGIEDYGHQYKEFWDAEKAVNVLYRSLYPQ
jgi:hypothetical protein